MWRDYHRLNTLDRGLAIDLGHRYGANVPGTRGGIDIGQLVELERACASVGDLENGVLGVFAILNNEMEGPMTAATGGRLVLRDRESGGDHGGEIIRLGSVCKGY